NPKRATEPGCGSARLSAVQNEARPSGVDSASETRSAGAFTLTASAIGAVMVRFLLGWVIHMADVYSGAPAAQPWRPGGRACRSGRGDTTPGTKGPAGPFRTQLVSLRVCTATDTLRRGPQR